MAREGEPIRNVIRVVVRRLSPRIPDMPGIFRRHDRQVSHGRDAARELGAAACLLIKWAWRCAGRAGSGFPRKGIAEQ